MALQVHALNYLVPALRIFRFAADTAPRVLELAHLSDCMRDCADAFGGVDASLPGALRNEHASGRYVKLCAVVKRNAARCPWLAEPLLACRSAASVASHKGPAPPSMHAFKYAPAALRIFRFAADSAPRVLELAHVSAFLRECAVEFGSADATLPGALRCEYASGRFAKLCAVVERNAARCPWLVAKVLRVYRSGAPLPAAALAPDVTRHDVNWGAEGARRHADLQLTHGGFGLARGAISNYGGCEPDGPVGWAQGPVGVTAGKHFFQVRVTAPGDGRLAFGWIDGLVSVVGRGSTVDWPGLNHRGTCTACSGSSYGLHGRYLFGTAGVASKVPPLSPAPANVRPCVMGCLLNLDSTPARMTVFVDGEPLAVQCPYDFPKDGRAWFPSVELRQSQSDVDSEIHSCGV
jgi:hypothetical protein